MAVYRADKKHGVAWITGASTGIGRQLALDLARDGWTVATSSHPESASDPVADADLATRIRTYDCDVTDASGMAQTVAAIEKDVGPIVLAVFNAGIYIPVYAGSLDLADFRKTYEVNVFGVLNGLAPVVERMQRRSRGHVVINGSVSSYLGWPSAGAYGATKAALNNMAEALRFDFEKMNIRIQIVNPGFVDTPLAARNAYFMPALMPVERASARIVKAIRKGGYETTFPWRLTWLMKFMRSWPHWARFRFMNCVTRWRGVPIARKRAD